MLTNIGSPSEKPKMPPTTYEVGMGFRGFESFKTLYSAGALRPGDKLIVYPTKDVRQEWLVGDLEVSGDGHLMNGILKPDTDYSIVLNISSK
ncbi:MAG: hypothetical protein JW727_00865 [Candidatus Aenigmarchaeota archaeon]|nr:hypothetical protein [Candidatus Aenigmarchaeota archaeon]